MRPECVAAVSQALGRDLKAGEAKDIEGRIVASMRRMAQRDPAAWQQMSAADRLTQAGQGAAVEILGEAKLKQQRAALQIAAVQRAQVKIGELQASGLKGLDALDRLVAFEADGKSNTLSIDTQSRSIARAALGRMLDVLTASKPKWFGLLENKEGVEAIVREIFGEPSGDPDAAGGAKIWKETAEALRQRFNRAGGDVGLLDDWGMPHHHSQMKVAQAGREAWIADILPTLKRDRYITEDGRPMTDQEIVGFLGEAWVTIATGGANKVTPGMGVPGRGSRANRGSASRQIHFKDADSYMAYQAKYGERSLYEVLVGHIEGVSKDIAMTETLGPNPDHTYRLLRDRLVQEGKIADPVHAGKYDEAAVRSENLYNIVAGKSAPVASEHMAKSFDTLRNWLTAARLGGAVISSLSDEATLYLTAHVNNLPALRVFRNELATLNPANRVEKRMALRAGLAMNTFISSLNRFGQEGLGRHWSSRMSGAVLRASGLNAITEARKRAFGVTMMSSLGAIVRDRAGLSTLDAADARMLRSKGITDADFAVWKQAQLEDWGGGNKTMLTAESIYRIPDAAIEPLGDPMKLREQAATKLLGMVLEETDVAIIEPGAKDRRLTGANLQRGTWKGELTRSVFLFKSFPLAMIQRHWSRAMSMPTRGGRAGYLAALIASTTVAGAVSMTIKDLLQGKNPRNLNPMEDHGVRNWIKAMLQGGSLGLYGDFLFSESNQYGGGPVASFLGPVIGLGEDSFKLTQGNLIEAAQGKETHVGAELVKFTKGNLPGASLWYAKAALDHMIFHQLQEYFSPGYLAQMRNRAYREFGQTYWWEPGDPVPTEGPDMETIVGEQ